MKPNLLLFILLVAFITSYYSFIDVSFAQGTIPSNAVYMPLVTYIKPTVAPIPTATNTPIPIPDVVIKYIFYDGRVPGAESDEYVEIENRGTVAVNMGGWQLYADDKGQDFTFPDFTIAPRQIVRVYTDETHPETGSFSFGYGKAIWNNNEGDCGYLYMTDNILVSEYCYAGNGLYS